MHPLLRLEHRRNEAFRTHDATALRKLLADEYRHVDYRGAVKTKEDEIAIFTSPRFRLGSFHVRQFEARIIGDVGVATGVNVWARAGYGPEDWSGSYRFTRISLKVRGVWRIVASHATKLGR